MAGRFRQSCCWEPVTAGPPACFYFGSLVRKNQNDPFLLRSRGTSTASRAGSAQDWASAGLATGRGTRAGSPRGQLGAEALAPGQAMSCPCGETVRVPARSRQVLGPRPAHTPSYSCISVLLRFALLHSIYCPP